MITVEDKLKCVQRLLMLRRRALTGLVADGLVRQEDAEREIQIMLAIEADYLQ